VENYSVLLRGVPPQWHGRAGLRAAFGALYPPAAGDPEVVHSVTVPAEAVALARLQAKAERCRGRLELRRLHDAAPAESRWAVDAAGLPPRGCCCGCGCKRQQGRLEPEAVLVEKLAERNAAVASKRAALEAPRFRLGAEGGPGGSGALADQPPGVPARGAKMVHQASAQLATRLHGLSARRLNSQHAFVTFSSLRVATTVRATLGR
jgi:hypothetical protein